MRHKDESRNIVVYNYKNAAGVASSYINWDNLNCCGGWNADERYLRTAVQRGRKLYAGIGVTMRDMDSNRDLDGRCEADRLLAEISAGLPDDCTAGFEDVVRTNGPYTTMNIFVCKSGSIKDYLDLGEVFRAYERLGVVLPVEAAERITALCHLPLESFAGGEKAFDYGYPVSVK